MKIKVIHGLAFSTRKAYGFTEQLFVRGEPRQKRASCAGDRRYKARIKQALSSIKHRFDFGLKKHALALRERQFELLVRYLRLLTEVRPE